MAQTKPPFLSTFGVLALAFPLAVTMMIREPEEGWIFILGALFLPVCWLITETLKFHSAENKPNLEDLTTLRQSVRSAGLLVLVPLTLTVIFTSGMTWITDAIEVRIMGSAFGIAMIIIGNAIPKRPASLSKGKATLAQRQSVARFSGITLMITGAVYAFASFITPADYSALVLITISVIGSGLVIMRCLSLAFAPKAST